jgi:ferritin-like metal-binding protein YciE
MAKTKKDALISWLNDAYAMEQSLVHNLEQKSKDAADAGLTSLCARLDEHVEETKLHAEMVKSCVERLGGDVSRFKNLLAKTAGLFRGSTKGIYDDVSVKNILESYAAENFEIASYVSLIAAATDIGDDETVSICSTILEQEKAMADWIQRNVPLVTHEYLSHHERA